MPVRGEVLKFINGLTQMTWRDMDRLSQGMIDGCANYSGDLEVEARCNDCTAAIDAHISYRIASGLDDNDVSLIVVQQRAGLSDAQQRANVKLAIFGGQNEPKDTIAGIIWAILERHTVTEGATGWNSQLPSGF